MVMESTQGLLHMTPTSSTSSFYAFYPVMTATRVRVYSAVVVILRVMPTRSLQGLDVPKIETLVINQTIDAPWRLLLSAPDNASN